MIGRRSILRALGGVALGGRTAAKLAVDATAKTIAEAGMGGAVSSALGGPVGFGSTIQTSIGDDGSYHRRALSMIKLAKLIGVPDWKRKEWRDSAKGRTSIDIDIASLVSVSPVAKIAMQRLSGSL